MTGFSKGHYEKIARIIKEENTGVGEGTEWVKDALDTYSLVNHLSKMFSEDNPLFDERKFIKVCGLSENEYYWRYSPLKEE